MHFWLPQLFECSFHSHSQIVFVRPASELGSLAQQWSFDQIEVVTLTDRYTHSISSKNSASLIIRHPKRKWEKLSLIFGKGIPKYYGI